MKQGVLAALALPVALLTSSAGAQATAGTYAVWLCREACPLADTARAVVAGYLVLFERPYRVDTLASPALRPLVDASMFLLLPDREDPTACFRLHRRTEEVALMAGIIPAGFTYWTREGNAFRISLYASPDAFYTLRARIQNGRLSSTARESGFIGTEFDNDAGVAHGLRIGPPDVRHCVSEQRPGEGAFESAPPPRR